MPSSPTHRRPAGPGRLALWLLGAGILAAGPVLAAPAPAGASEGVPEPEADTAGSDDLDDLLGGALQDIEQASRRQQEQRSQQGSGTVDGDTDGAGSDPRVSGRGGSRDSGRGNGDVDVSVGIPGIPGMPGSPSSGRNSPSSGGGMPGGGLPGGGLPGSGSPSGSPNGSPNGSPSGSPSGSSSGSRTAGSGSGEGEADPWYTHTGGGASGGPSTPSGGGRPSGGGAAGGGASGEVARGEPSGGGSAGGGTEDLDEALEESLGDFDGMILAEGTLPPDADPSDPSGGDSREPAGSGREDGVDGEGGDDRPGSREGSEEIAATGGGGGRQSAASSDLPEPESECTDKDVFACQLYELAMSETDPDLRERLLEEYRRYKAGG